MKTINQIIEQNNITESSIWKYGYGFMQSGTPIKIKDSDAKYIAIRINPGNNNEILFGEDNLIKKLDDYHNQDGKVIESVNRLKLYESYSFDSYARKSDEYHTIIIKVNN